ncbi:hypothetical protein AB0M46_38265 [Dactylosporangium sp. NPDC051485]|uniref:hypothetical protein n=1 Tax=Dactylosporangium sp. NPDC051485 TaxID=3154846 RepID=UPI00343B31BA
MVERVQVALTPVAWDRLTVGAGVGYATLVSVPLAVGYPESTPLYVICALLTAAPLAFRDHLDFRAVCLLVTVVLVLAALCGVFFGLFVYVPVALPLVLAALPTPKRYQRAKLVAVGVVLAAVLVLFAIQFARF